MRQYTQSQFRFKIDQTILKEFVTAIGSLVRKSTINVTKKGVICKAVCPCEIGFIEAKLLPEAFSDYPIENPNSFGIELSKIKQFISGLHEKHVIVNYDGDKSLYFNSGPIEYRHSTRDLRKIRDFTHTPDIDATFKCLINSDFIHKINDHFDQVASESRISYDPQVDELIIESTKEDGLTNQHDHRIGFKLDSEQFNIIKNGYAYTRIPLDWFNAIATEFPTDRLMTISFGKDTPIKIEYEIAKNKLSGKATLGTVKFVLDPQNHSVLPSEV